MICIYHSRDLDGWCSAAIVKLWHSKYRTNELTLIGWDYGQPIPEIPINTEVVMVDISFAVDTMEALLANNNLEWCDHHISAINTMKDRGIDPHGIRDVNFAACELTWKYFFGTTMMPEFIRLLGRYDCFGHKGTYEEQNVLEFQYAARTYFKNPEDCLEAIKWDLGYGTIASEKTIDNLFIAGKSIYKYLRSEAEQDYKSGISVDFDGFKFVAINKKRFNPINFGINYHENGYDGAACYHYENGVWNFSLYNDNGLVDCSYICKNRGGGGHKGAAGFITKDISFITNL